MNSLALGIIIACLNFITPPSDLCLDLWLVCARGNYQLFDVTSFTVKVGAGMFAIMDIKLDMIRIYLENRVPYCKIEDMYQDDKQGMHVLQLNCNGRPVTVTVSRAFIDERSPAEILTTIKQHHLDSYFQEKKIGNIVITNDRIMSNVN